MKSSLPIIGAVTVTHNSAGVLAAFLGSMHGQVGVALRLYVVDSGSTDATADIMASVADAWGDRLVFIENVENVGFAEGSNQGIIRAISDGADRVLLINNDTTCDPGMVSTLLESAVENDLQIVSPLILTAEPDHPIWYAGGTLSSVALVARHQLEGRPAGEAPTHLTKTGFGSACCLLIDPAVFAEAGMFDPVFFVYFDDVDLAVRVKSSGYQYWLEPRAVLIHEASALTGGKRSAFTLRWTARNWPLMIRKRQRGWRRVVALAFVQAWMLARVVVLKDAPRILLLRQQCFVEALRMNSGGDVPRPSRQEVLA